MLPRQVWRHAAAQLRVAFRGHFPRAVARSNADAAGKARRRGEECKQVMKARHYSRRCLHAEALEDEALRTTMPHAVPECATRFTRLMKAT